MTDTLTRAELSDRLVEEVGLTRAESAALIDLTLDSIIGALEKGEAVKLARFGNFTLRDKRSRTGRNPRTGQDAPISARRVVTFKASPVLRARLAPPD